jgi:hypothetical protein
MKIPVLMRAVFSGSNDCKVRSGVLQLTLGISLVISILCASIILLVYYSKLSFLDKDIQNRLQDNANSGIQYIMATRSEIQFNQQEILDLFSDGNDSVEVYRQPWGLFELCTSRSFQASHVYLKSAMITALPSDIGQAAIYSPDNNAPLYLVGNTIIKGTVYASDRKFSTGYIDGKGFNRPNLMEGDAKKSEPLLPELDTMLLHQVKLILLHQESAYRLNSIDRIPTDTLISFENSKANYYYSNQSIELDDSISGNIIIHSGIKVRITAEASLLDVLIIAPDIDIDKGFKGSVQCFATRSIIVGAESKLQYPSSLVLIGDEQDSTIVINHDAVVEGIAVIKGHDQTIGSKGVLKMEKGSILHGMAYINGAADIQGSIWGHITSRTFQAKVAGAVYGNHLLNGEIDGTKRSKYMPGNLLWANTKQFVIAKWIQ